ncbi:hypothetical protein [Arthrobacter sp. 31Y]|uniref:hypothetical protein n=1 Tax=Arthrobacter sp. 31Y TaxID=1115632 RepID=UPI0004677574|nr:hypothetical protein [Arthrobacter sp. 31Y]
MFGLKHAGILTDAQLGQALRGALQVEEIVDLIGSGSNVVGLLATVDHEAAKRFPHVLEHVKRQKEIALYTAAVTSVFDGLEAVRESMLSNVEAFFQEYDVDSAEDGVQEQIDGETFNQIPLTAAAEATARCLMNTAAHAVQEEIEARRGL